eukprot:5971182-Prymnesium_polylepis.1
MTSWYFLLRGPAPENLLCVRLPPPPLLPPVGTVLRIGRLDPLDFHLCVLSGAWRVGPKGVP